MSHTYIHEQTKTRVGGRGIRRERDTERDRERERERERDRETDTETDRERERGGGRVLIAGKIRIPTYHDVFYLTDCLEVRNC